ncbi:hypothetical protein PYCC9005_002039 [Savitreella phatthalungensis]
MSDKADHQFVENVDAEKSLSPGIHSVDSDAEYLAAQNIEPIIRKMDLRILPVMSILYLMSFLDRTNIGNAKIAGMVKDLHLTDQQYNLCLTCFFFTYAAVEVPSNLMLKKFGAKVWLPFIMVLWGAACIGLGFTTDFATTLVARLALGLAEGGLFPGVTYFLSCWYPRSRMAFRIAFFFSAATVAGAFGGLLAYGIDHMNGIGGLRGWRWIFVIEGLLTVVVAFAAYFFIPHSPQRSLWLSEEDKRVLQYKMDHDGGHPVPFDDSFQWKYVRRGVLDWKLWINFVIYVTMLASLYSVALSLPSIIKGLGYTTTDSAQLHSVPPYIVAAVCVITSAWLADKYMRTPVICGMLIVAIIGWAIMISVKNLHARYAGVFLAAAGSYSAFPPMVALLTSNIGGKTKRATVIGIQVGIGGMAGTISSNIFRAKDAPKYKFGLTIDIILCVVALSFTIINFVAVTFANRQKQRDIDSGKAATYTRQELAEMGDASPYFKFQL